MTSEASIDFFLKEVSDVEEFGRMLDQDKFDVIFVDLNLAGASGMNLLPGVRIHHTNKDAAMIMVAGADQAEVALEALRAGFTDYIEKSALSKSSLERATVNALQKRNLSHAALAAQTQTKSIEAVLKSFSNACSQEMRPMMMRMVRQIRQLRSDAMNEHLTDNIIQIESTCARMEEFFEDLSSLAEEGKLSTVVEDKIAQFDDLAVPKSSQANQRTIDPSRPSSKL